jgi:ABC-type polysaccharide/polyol phosphate transport system ATPase subunit
MSTGSAIVDEGLSKRYRLGAREPYGVLRDRIGQLLRSPFRRRDRAEPAWIWALDDLTFEIGEGDVVGIVGRNGSGKSTLLKILSRITEPTRGRALVRGRVGSLLEAGTGFHPELTGRENVFVNGAILGMRRQEIQRRFDEIVAFAGVERFLDTPVKYYSSGMQMRLAFAVAAHLEPDVLLVDEVLAVGDAEFQRRCLGKMHDVSQEGRTVLFVSHQMGQIRRLCRSAVWLDRGRMRAFGPTDEVLAQYEQAAGSRDAEAAGGGVFGGWELGTGGHVLDGGSEPFVLRIRISPGHPVSEGHFGLGLLSTSDEIVGGWDFEPISLSGEGELLEIALPQLPIRPGVYRWTFTLFDCGNNLSGGRLVEKWVAMPDLQIHAQPVGHSQDAFAGVLNVPASLRTGSGAVVESAGRGDHRPSGPSRLVVGLG